MGERRERRGQKNKGQNTQYKAFFKNLSAFGRTQRDLATLKRDLAPRYKAVDVSIATRVIGTSNGPRRCLRMSDREPDKDEAFNPEWPRNRAPAVQRSCGPMVGITQWGVSKHRIVAHSRPWSPTVETTHYRGGGINRGGE